MNTNNTLITYKYNSNRIIFEKAYSYLRNRSEEAWFGENNPLKVGLIAYIDQIKVLYDERSISSDKDKKMFVESIKSILENMEKLIAKETNVEKCQIGLVNQVNAYCYPMCWDSEIVGKSVEAKKLRANLNDIIETKTGFKFKSKKQKYIIVVLGLGLFDKKNEFTSEEIAAILFHELGHAFQHMLIGINANIAYNSISESIKWTYVDLISFSKTVIGYPFILIFTILYSILRTFTRLFKNDINEKKIEEQGKRILDKMSKKDTINRKEEIDEMQKETDEMIEASLTNNNGGGKLTKLFSSIGFVIKSIISPIIYIVELPANMYLFSNKSKLNKNKQFEEFADMFATYYGLGSSLTSGLKRLIKPHEEVDLGSLNFLNYVPLLNLVTSSFKYYERNIGDLVNGYPDGKTRIANIYKGLEYELANNKDLSSKDKADIKSQMEESKKIFDEYVYAKGSKNFVYRIYNVLMRTSIDKTAKNSDVVKNVLDVINKYKHQLDET